MNISKKINIYFRPVANFKLSQIQRYSIRDCDLFEFRNFFSGRPLRLLGPGSKEKEKKPNHDAGLEELKPCGQNAAFLLLYLVNLINSLHFQPFLFHVKIRSGE